MRLILAAAIAALSIATAQAQQAVVIAPYPMLGQGVFTASTSSAALTSALSLTANSKAFPTGKIGGGGILTLEPQPNASTGVYVCWQGGTCTAAIGEYLAPGQSRTVALPEQNMTSQPPTIISTGTPAVVVEW